MSLPIQSIRLSEVAEAGLNLGGFSSCIDPAVAPLPRALGQCFALDPEPLAEQAESRGLSWHVHLLRLAVIGFWEQRSRTKVFVCYTLNPEMIRVFICTHQKHCPEKLYQPFEHRPVYIESGRDGFAADTARPLAYWEPSDTAIALWPRGLEGETGGERVVDIGNAVSYFSYPTSDHAEGKPLDPAGPEYIRVPSAERVAFNAGNKIYHYLNRWAAVEMDLKLTL